MKRLLLTLLFASAAIAAPVFTVSSPALPLGGGEYLLQLFPGGSSVTITSSVPLSAFSMWVDTTLLGPGTGWVEWSAGNAPIIIGRGVVFVGEVTMPCVAACTTITLTARATGAGAMETGTIERLSGVAAVPEPGAADLAITGLFALWLGWLFTSDLSVGKLSCGHESASEDGKTSWCGICRATRAMREGR